MLFCGLKLLFEMCKHFCQHQGQLFFCVCLFCAGAVQYRNRFGQQRHSQLRAMFTVHIDVQSRMARLHKQAWFRPCRMRGGKQTLSESMVCSLSVQNQSRLLSVCEEHAGRPLPSSIHLLCFIACFLADNLTHTHWPETGPESDKGLNIKDELID